MIEALEARHMRRFELEETIGCASGLVSRLANGTRRPGLSIALKIQDLLGVPAESWTRPPVREEAALAPTEAA